VRRQQTTAAKLSSFRCASDRKVALVVLREWSKLSWLLPREQTAAAFAAEWLLRRGWLGWREWSVQRRKWQQLSDSLEARWTNLHLTAAWQAWRAWLHNRQEKTRMARTIARRWTNLHLAAAFQAWVELVRVRRHAAPFVPALCHVSDIDSAQQACSARQCSLPQPCLQGCRHNYLSGA
jgi:hypothetical protein